jgi:tRNA pseudouridine38-40 synthase
MAGDTMRNLKLTLEYDGTHYLGWQRQPQGMTIQEALESAVLQITGEETQVIGAGRTDAGVHARGQVANLHTTTPLTPERFRGALNAVLPRDIAVLEVEEVPDDFNSRFAARSKLYRYTVWNQRVRPVFERGFCWHVRWEIDLDLLAHASAMLPGEHDFSAFRSSNTDTETTVRTVYRAEWRRDEPKLLFEIEGNGFLYNMVRALVGTLVEVGRGKISPAEFGRILESKDRTRAGRTAPAQGLCLMRVDYEPPPGATLP